MKELHIQVEAVKGSLSGGCATPSTATALQSLFNADDQTNRKPTPAVRPVVKGRVQDVASKSSASRRLAPVQILEDDAANLAPKERYALATEIVNIALKALSESTGSQQRSMKQTSSTIRKSNGESETPGKLHGSPSISRQVMQPTSGNITPRGDSATISKRSRRSSSTGPAKENSGPSAHVVATAECARLAFSHLRSVDEHKIGIRELPKLQLETGMLALAARLCSHGLQTLAAKELRTVKARLESYQKTKGNLGKPTTTVPPIKETMVSLLRLNIGSQPEKELLPLAISYQSTVLKMIATLGKPRYIEGLLDHLDPERSGSPASLVEEQYKISPDNNKAARQLEVLSTIILSLCPSSSASADEITTNDIESQPSPLVVFKLQVLALRLRKRWWILASHKPNAQKELIEPFAKCMATLLRRLPSVSDSTVTYTTICNGYTELINDGVPQTTGALFPIHRTLSCMAESIKNLEDAESWAGRMSEDCMDLDPTHARRVATSLKHVSLGVQIGHAGLDFSDIASTLESSLKGGFTDYELLLTELVVRLPTLSDYGPTTGELVWRIMSNSAIFAQRFVRSYPGKCLSQVQSVIGAALRVARPDEDMMSWLASESATVFLNIGTLSDVAKLSTSKPLQVAWSSSCDALLLGRILTLLIWKGLKDADSKILRAIVDEPGLPSLERGILLEYQLQCVVEHMGKSRYHKYGSILLMALLERLSELYDRKQYSTRRSLVAMQVLKLCESSPDFLPTQVQDVWRRADTDPFSEDSSEGLRAYAKDLRASLMIFDMFRCGKISLDIIKESVAAWYSLLNTCKDIRALQACIYDVGMLRKTLESLAACLATLGEDTLRLSVLQSLARLHQLRSSHTPGAVFNLINLSRQWLEMGFAEKTASTLSEARVLLDSLKGTSLVELQWHIMNAEYLSAIENVEEAEVSMSAASILRESHEPEKVSRDERTDYEVLHARAWLIQSTLQSQKGSPHSALADAKHAVKVLSSTWHRLERKIGNDSSVQVPSSEPLSTPDVDTVTQGVSKLQLAPRGTTSPSDQMSGPRFWPLIPLLSKALMHLSMMYVFHGMYQESSYYLERALEISGPQSPCKLRSKVQFYKARLLAIAGRLEDAELILASEAVFTPGDASMLAIDNLRARCVLKMKEGNSDESIPFLKDIERMLVTMGDSTRIRDVCTQQVDEPLDPEVGRPPTKPASRRRAGAERADATVKSSLSTRMPPRSRTVNKAKTALKAPVHVGASPCYMLGKFRAEVALDQELAQLSSGVMVEATAAMPFKQLILNFRMLMNKATAALQSDMTFNILPESVLSFPAILATATDGGSPHERQVVQTKSAGKTKKKSAATSKSRQHGNDSKEGVLSLLAEARDCLLRFGNITGKNSVSDMYVFGSMCSMATALLLGAGGALPAEPLQSGMLGLTLEGPRNNALQHQREAALLEIEHKTQTTPFRWPSAGESDRTDMLTTTQFQSDYVDILPRAWTVVSLSLSEDCNELYAARYHAGGEPFIVRLPFSRHKTENSDDDIFDYQAGKSELQDIVQLSNYSCHNGADLAAKGAKSGWWNEREALDRRLQELLLNIENIWLGGFRGVLSPRQRDIELLLRFCKAIESILDRHLPSRQANKGSSMRVTLDHGILDLFVDLGSDQDGVIDFDEPVADLLYFVVDVLQFNGERNAYDEIDFDQMTVEVIDALRVYHDAASDKDTGESHLIMILDKRLQAFPWESLPCLENVSVSRVGSMLTIRERILAMRKQVCAATDLPDEEYSVSRSNGTYILNPSEDLNSTQKVLGPALARLGEASDNNWNAIVNQAPSEDNFSTALTTSSITLYFGHGAGSQYIRPRTIRKLDSCSEVVWLMGCSSGAVTEYGDLEPHTVPFAYLSAGTQSVLGLRDEPDKPTRTAQKCMAVIATLWDVTDKDIDRFSLAVGEEWGLWQPSTQSVVPPAKTPRKRERVALPSTPPQAPKTPKTPKSRKPLSQKNTPSRSRSRPWAEVGKKLSLSDAVAKSRDACYLKFLNGAAPVVYGVPVYLGD